MRVSIFVIRFLVRLLFFIYIDCFCLCRISKCDKGKRPRLNKYGKNDLSLYDFLAIFFEI